MPENQALKMVEAAGVETGARGFMLLCSKLTCARPVDSQKRPSSEPPPPGAGHRSKSVIVLPFFIGAFVPVIYIVVVRTAYLDFDIPVETKEPR